jgi:hypothetical protein
MTLYDVSFSCPLLSLQRVQQQNMSRDELSHLGVLREIDVPRYLWGIPYYDRQVVSVEE